MRRARRIRAFIPVSWKTVFLGVTTNFAVLEILGAFNASLGLLQLATDDSTAALAVKVFWLFVCVTAMNLASGFTIGMILAQASKRTVIGNTILSTALTPLLFFVFSSYGLNLIPGVSFETKTDNLLPNGFLLWITLLPPNNLLGAIYGALRGKSYLSSKATAEIPGVAHLPDRTKGSDLGHRRAA